MVDGVGLQLPQAILQANMDGFSQRPAPLVDPKTPDMRSGAVTSSRHAETAASPSDSHQPLAGEHSVGLAWSLAHRACWWSKDLIADGMLCPLWCGVSTDAEV
jgi:hypothetical protein